MSLVVSRGRAMAQARNYAESYRDRPRAPVKLKLRGEILAQQRAQRPKMGPGPRWHPPESNRSATRAPCCRAQIHDTTTLRSAA